MHTIHRVCIACGGLIEADIYNIQYVMVVCVDPVLIIIIVAVAAVVIFIIVISGVVVRYSVSARNVL